MDNAGQDWLHLHPIQKDYSTFKNIKIVNKPFSSILPKKRGEEETIVFKQGLVVLDIVLNYIPSSKLTIFQKCLACVQ